MAGTILTNIGLSKLAAATPQNQLNITHIAVGNGSGGFPTLSPTMTALTNEVWRSTASNPIKDGSNSNYVYFETNIPPEVGPFDVREIACFDINGDMIAIGHTSLIQKPAPAADANFAVAVKIFIALENATDFDLIYQNTEVTSHNSLSNINDIGGHDSIYARNVNCLKNLTEYAQRVDGQKFDVSGYYENTLVGGGTFTWDANRSKADHNGGTIIAPEAISAWNGTQADIATILDWTGSGVGCFVAEEGQTSPEKFGGTHSVNIAAAVSTGCDVYGEGQYNIDTALTVSTSGAAIHLKKVTTSLSSGTAIVISGDKNTLTMSYDSQGGSVTPVQITGEGNKIDVTIKNLTARAGMVNTYLGGVDNRGKDTEVIASLENFTNDGYTINGSMPHAVSFQGGAERGTVDVRQKNGVAGVVCGLSKTPRVKYADFDGMTDNGIYSVEGCDVVTVDFVRYKGDEEPFVASTGTSMIINNFEVIDQKGAIGVQDCVLLRINKGALLYTDVDAAKAARVPLIQTRSPNTLCGRVEINNVSGTTYGNNIIQITNGKVSHLSIKNNTLDHKFHDVAQAKTLLSYADGDSVDIQNNTVTVSDETGTLGSGDTFTLTIPNGLGDESTYSNNTLISKGAQRIRGINFFQSNMMIAGTPSVETTFGPYIREEGYLGSSKKVFGNSEPAGGTWGAGDLVFSNQDKQLAWRRNASGGWDKVFYSSGEISPQSQAAITNTGAVTDWSDIPTVYDGFLRIQDTAANWPADLPVAFYHAIKWGDTANQSMIAKRVGKSDAYTLSRSTVGDWAVQATEYNTGNMAYAKNNSGSTIAAGGSIQGAELSPIKEGLWLNSSQTDVLDQNFALFISQELTT